MNPEQQPTPTPTPAPQQPGAWQPTEQPASQQPTPVAPSAFGAPQQPAGADAFGANYLDQIATTEPVHVHKFAMLGLIGGILVALIVGIMIMMSSGGPDLATQAKSISGRITTIKTVVDAQQKHINDTSLSETNITLSALLTTMSTDLTATMKAKKITVTSKQSTTEKTYAATLTKKLDDAYQRGTLDRTYAPQLVYELTLLRTKLAAMKKTSSSTSIDTFCADAITNLDAIIEPLQNFSATQ